MKKIKLINIAFIFLGVIASHACTDYKYVDESAFLGTWEVKGRKIYSEMKIRIVKENDKLKGYVTSPPNNNFGQMFVENNENWITEISRGSNYYFKITERKIAKELFSQYELETKSVYYATFSENKNKIYLTPERPNKFIQESSIYYERSESDNKK